MDTNPALDIEAKCEAAGVELNDVLAEAGVSRTTWWRWREGRFDPRMSTIRKLQQALDRRAPTSAESDSRGVAA